jgi:hypothetical protein
VTVVFGLAPLLAVALRLENFCSRLRYSKLCLLQETVVRDCHILLEELPPVTGTAEGTREGSSTLQLKMK